MGTKWVTPAERKKMKMLSAEGKTYREIGEIMKRSPTAVSHALKKVRHSTLVKMGNGHTNGHAPKMTTKEYHESIAEAPRYDVAMPTTYQGMTNVPQLMLDLAAAHERIRKLEKALIKLTLED